MLTLTAAQIDGLLAAFAWPFLRALAFVTSAPLIGHRAVPRTVKLGLALLFATLIGPTLPPAPAIGAPGSLVVLAQQLVVGFAMGLAMHVAFAAIALAGDLIGLQTGLSFASFVDPASSGQNPILGTFLGLLAMLVFFSIDGHLMAVSALARSFEVIPVAAIMPEAGRWHALVTWGGELFRIGFHLALPVLAAMLACNLALGALMRAAPQFNLFAVGFPIALVVGLAMLALMLPYLGGPIQLVLEEALAPFR